jgi:hypothetical protein
MIVPRFTIRTAFAVVTGCAFLFLVAGMAYRGQTWAWGVTIGAVSLLISALVHAAWFGIVWLFTQLPSRPQPTDASAVSPRPRGIMPANSSSTVTGESH